MTKKKICVMGLGYIGLPTASLFATRGHKVLGVDVNSQIIETINKGKVHIVEPELDLLVKTAVSSGNLKASLKPKESDVFIMCVPTPFKSDGQNIPEPDLRFIKDAAKTIAPFLRENNLVILESTSPVGTTEYVEKLISEIRPNLKIYYAHCPERVLPGRILKEAVENDRIIGGTTKQAAELARDLYKTFVIGDIYLSDTKTAEFAKLVENSYRDVNIAFANELSIICDKLGINVWEVIKLSNKHPRVNIHQPGPGVGGHCIAVDPWFIVYSAPKEAKIIKTAREINDKKPYYVIEKIKKISSKFKEPVIGLLGLTYKKDIDDLRESPALKITQEIIKAKIGKILVCEPHIKEIKDIELFPFEYVVKESDIVVLLVDHKEFREIDREILKEKVIIDTRGVLQ
jgi:UDP-N-acetyl-D-mannosaminuronic acid dehydrogenase